MKVRARLKSDRRPKKNLEGEKVNLEKVEK